MSLPLIPAPARLELLDGEPYPGPAEPTASTAVGNRDDGGYRLQVGADTGFSSDAADHRGASAARSSATQLVELTDRSVPALEIEDAPRYPWRGLMIDVCRHFFGPATLRKVLDLAALYKLNVLHLHLTDDQGWRYEVPNRPELVERASTSEVDGGPGGHLSVADLAELTAYAAERGITIVGEIDLPGHTAAALHAVPALNPDGLAREVYTGTEVGHSTLRLDLPETAAFLEDAVGALVEQTTGDFVHVGGDEVRLLSPEEYAAFIQHVEALVLRLGKRPVFWQEAAPALQDPRSVLQLWDSNADPAPVVAAAAHGHQVILSPGNRAYLDMKYDADTELGLDWAGHVDVRDAYDWDPATLVPGLPPEAILGVEAALWTETIRTEDDLFSMLLPRLPAIAEVAWSVPEVRAWEAFAEDLPAHRALWDARGLAHADRPLTGH
ncbi:family 20 glycosylhydrolase [Pseudactinotalea suaedae]|uniref:family 20 glycosylhydrolase n=1 Tax=Pseudactinotalea suaedae TaxID=1524924 RepID=UPI001391EB47|nr:family 20 glycosylhydrolase [Pseudactinotalea suaedae]